MRMIFLAAALTIASVPALAQSEECPQGTTKTSPDGSPVTCSADTSDEGAAADQGGDQGGAVLQLVDSSAGPVPGDPELKKARRIRGADSLNGGISYV